MDYTFWFKMKPWPLAKAWVWARSHQRWRSKTSRPDFGGSAPPFPHAFLWSISCSRIISLPQKNLPIQQKPTKPRPPSPSLLKSHSSKQNGNQTAPMDLFSPQHHIYEGNLRILFQKSSCSSSSLPALLLQSWNGANCLQNFSFHWTLI